MKENQSSKLTEQEKSDKKRKILIEILIGASIPLTVLAITSSPIFLCIGVVIFLIATVFKELS